MVVTLRSTPYLVRLENFRHPFGIFGILDISSHCGVHLFLFPKFSGTHALSLQLLVFCRAF